MPSITLDPSKVTIPADAEDEEKEKDINWDALRPQARVSLEEARAARKVLPPKEEKVKKPKKKQAKTVDPGRLESSMREEIDSRTEPFSRGEVAKALGYAQTVPATNRIFEKLEDEGFIRDTGQRRRGGVLYERATEASLARPSANPEYDGIEPDDEPRSTFGSVLANPEDYLPIGTEAREAGRAEESDPIAAAREAIEAEVNALNRLLAEAEEWEARRTRLTRALEALRDV